MINRTSNKIIKACVSCEKPLAIGEDIYMERAWRAFALCARCYEEYKALKEVTDEKGRQEADKTSRSPI